MIGRMRLNSPPNTTVCGIEHVDQPGDPGRQPLRLDGERGERRRIVRSRSGQHLVDRASAPVLVEAGPVEQRPFADLGLPAADRTARAT